MKAAYLETAKRLIAQTATDYKFAITYQAVFDAVAAYADSRIFLTCGRFGVALKLPGEVCQTIMEEGAGGPLKYFEKGHVKKGYLVLSDTVLNDPARLSELVKTSVAFVQTAD